MRIKNALLVVSSMLSFAVGSFADTLPNAPVAKVREVKPVATQKFWSRPTLKETAQMVPLGGLLVTDLLITSNGTHQSGANCVQVTYGTHCTGFLSQPEGNTFWYGRYPSVHRLVLVGAGLFVADWFLLHKTERSKHAAIRWAGRLFIGEQDYEHVRGIASWER